MSGWCATQNQQIEIQRVFYFNVRKATQQTMIRLKDVFEVSFAFHEVSIGLETCFMRVLRVSLAHFLKRVSLKPN